MFPFSFNRTVGQELSFAWHRFVTFARYIVGVSNGVSTWELKPYLDFTSEQSRALALHSSDWTFVVYGIATETLQGVAWIMLAFFAVTLVAHVVIRGFESKHRMTQGRGEAGTT